MIHYFYLYFDLQQQHQHRMTQLMLCAGYYDTIWTKYKPTKNPDQSDNQPTRTTIKQQQKLKPS